MAQIQLTRAILLISAIIVGGCDDPPLSSSITRSAGAPSALVNLTGTWAGSAIDSLGRVEMVWEITQRGTELTGNVATTTHVGMPLYSGSVSGTIASNVLRFTVTVPAGRILDLPDCALDLTGSATDIQAGSMAGTYTGIHSCLGAIEGGRFLFIRQ